MRDARRPNLLLLLLSFLLCLAAWPPGAGVRAAAAAPPKVLLVYDSLAKGTERESNVPALQRLLASYGAQVTITSADGYQAGSMQSFAKVIVLVQTPDLPAGSEAFERDREAYRGDLLHIGDGLPSDIGAQLGVAVRTLGAGTVRIASSGLSQADIPVQVMPYLEEAGSGTRIGVVTITGKENPLPYAVQLGRLTYVPYFQAGNASEIALADVLRRWFQTGKDGRMYLVVKEVYPFSDLKLLEQMADRFYEAGMPFVVSARPVLANTDYPAMQRYAQTLRYLQSRNGSVLMNVPAVVWSYDQKDDQLGAKLETFLQTLADSGVAPLGVGAELYWTYDKVYAEAGLAFADSAVLFPDEKPIYVGQADTAKAFTSAPYAVTLPFLEGLERVGGVMPALPTDTALVLGCPQTSEELETEMKKLTASGLTFADYKEGVHEVKAGALSIASRGGAVTVNGKALDLNDSQETVNADFRYADETKQSFSRMFAIENNIFLVLIVLSLLVFGGLFLVGRRLYRDKYRN